MNNLLALAGITCAVLTPIVYWIYLSIFGEKDE